MRSDGLPAEPTPVPQQLQAEFTDAFWRSLAWQGVTWLGQRVERAPTDLIAYQELVADVRPDWIVALRANGEGSPDFFASLCDLVGSGRVVAVGPEADSADQSQHPRVEYVEGASTAKETQERVAELVGDDANCMVVIPPAPLQEIVAEFKAYAPLVGVGSYAIVEGTIVNGHPVVPSFGPGPSEALQQILKNRRDFAPDHRPERFGLTFNPRGFLRRVE